MRASHSEIVTYLDCRVKHMFKYRKRLPIVGLSERLEQGTAVHAGLEQALKGLDFDLAPKAAMDAYSSGMVFPSTEDMNAIAAATRAGIEFLRFIDPVEVLAVEQKFVFDFQDWTVPGVIDFAFKDRYGRHHVLDWKTANKLPQDTTGNLDAQTAIYAYHWMKTHGLESMFAGRCYLRLEAPQITITKKPQRVSLQSKCSKADYERYAAEHPEHTGKPDDHQKALESFGRWWSHHEDLVTLEYCEAMMRQWRNAAAEIEQNLAPLANLRPKMCGLCEYQGKCADWILNGENDNG